MIHKLTPFIRPALAGLLLAALGLPVPDGQEQPYEVLLIGTDGTATVYARHGD